MQSVFQLINKNNAALSKHLGNVDLFLHNLKINRNSKVRVLYNTIARMNIPINASSSPIKVIKDLEEYATENMHERPKSFFIRANINYEGKSDSTAERQKLDINRVYWFAKEINTVDEQFLSTRPLAQSIRLNTSNKGNGIRFSSIPVTTMPFWVRDSCYPTNGYSNFFYFDVATAEFANLLLHVNNKKYKEIYFDYDLYMWIYDQISCVMGYTKKYSRLQIKQISMALICGATYKVVMSILKVSEDKAESIVSKFWGSMPDVYDFLEDIFLKSKLDSDGSSIQLMDNHVSENVIDQSQFQFKDIVKRKISASFIRDSFMIRYSNLLKDLFNNTNRRLCFAWVDSCLIPIQDNQDSKYILKDLKRFCIFPLKLKYKTSSTWGEASSPEKIKTLIIDK